MVALHLCAENCEKTENEISSSILQSEKDKTFNYLAIYFSQFVIHEKASRFPGIILDAVILYFHS